MLRISLSLAAAALALTGAASATTIQMSDVMARDGAVAGEMLDLGGTAVRFTAFGSPAQLSPAHTVISVAPGFSISNLKFNDLAPGRLTATTRTLLVNDVEMRFADIGGLTFRGPMIALGRGGADSTEFELEAFDVEPVVTPLPAAGILMAAGLFGIGFAARGRRRR